MTIMIPSRRHALFLFFVLSASTLHAATVFTVATFNCEWLIKSKIEFKYEEDALGDDEREAKFDEAVQAVAKVIKEIDADVISLTEVGPDEDVEALRIAVKEEGLDYPHKGVCISADTATRQHVAVLSKFPLNSVERTIGGREFYDAELDDPEEEKHTGVSKGMKVRFEVDGKTIHLYACHLISERGGFESDAQRVAQASIIRRHYLESLNRGEHVIVTGDLNAQRGSPPLRRIRGRDDLFGDLIQPGHSNYFEEEKLDERWTYEFKGTREQIDHVLPSWSFTDATTRSQGIQGATLDVTHTISTGKKASDHRPFLVTFRLR